MVSGLGPNLFATRLCFLNNPETRRISVAVLDMIIPDSNLPSMGSSHVKVADTTSPQSSNREL